MADITNQKTAEIDIHDRLAAGKEQKEAEE
jgi:hypothetical protein